MCFAPACFNVRAASLIVAPEVKTSSTMMKVVSCKLKVERTDDVAVKQFLTFSSRASFVFCSA